MSRPDTFSWSFLPGEDPLTLDEVVAPMVNYFLEKFAEEPKYLFLHPENELLEEGITKIHSMEIVPNDRLRKDMYMMAVTPSDIFADHWRKWKRED